MTHTDSSVSGDRRLLDTPEAHDVGGLARRGALWSAGLIVGQQLVRLVATAILARLLLASDYGLVGMAAALTAFLQQFADAGLSWATIQREDLTESQVHGLFWINVGFGGLLWLACVGAAPLVSRFFGRDELTMLVVALGFGFVISGFSVQPLALLKRAMRFRELTRVEISTQACASAVGIAMAFSGLGYWALVGQALAGPIVRLALAFVVSGYRARPPSDASGVLSMVTFGGFLTAYGLVNYFARNLDNILIGKVWGAESLGYYGRAYFLMTLPSMLATSTLATVMVPALSRLRNEPERFGDAYRRAVRVIAFVGFPIAGGLAVAAPELVRMIYGPRWGPVVPILVWLALAAITQPIHNTMGWLYVAVGRGRDMFLWGVVATAVLSVGFVIAVQWGPVGVAIAYAALMVVVLTVPALYFAHRAAHLPLGKTLVPLLPSFAATGAMMLLVWIVGEVISQFAVTWVWVLLAKVAVGVAIYVGLAYAFSRDEIIELSRVIAEALPAATRSASCKSTETQT